MKIKASLITKLSIGLLAAGSLAACNQNKTAGTAGTTTAAPASGSVVFVNQDSLLAKYDYFKDMTKRLDDKNKAANDDVGARRQAMQREVADYQRTANTLSADARSLTEQKLNRDGQDFQNYQQNTAAQLQNEQATEQQKLYEKVSAVIKDYAKEKGYKMVLTFQKGNTNLWYADPSADVTADVLKRLNDAYAKEKK